MIAETKPVNETIFAFVDVETTGLSAAFGGRVCEVAVLRRRGGERLETFCELLHPQCPIPPEVSRIHGITDAMVRGKPAFADIAPRLLALLSDSVVVCHNADFDVSFLSSELERVGLKFPPVPVLDTLRFARKHGGFASNKLGNIARELNFSSEGWHRALNDVKMTEHVFLHFLQKFSECGAGGTLSDLLRLQTERLGKKPKI